MQLVRMSRQNIADTQKRLKCRNGSRLEKRENMSLSFQSIQYLLPDTVVRVGETAVAPLAEETQLEPLAHGFVLKHRQKKESKSMSLNNGNQYIQLTL